MDKPVKKTVKNTTLLVMLPLATALTEGVHAETETRCEPPKQWYGCLPHGPENDPVHGPLSLGRTVVATTSSAMMVDPDFGMVKVGG